MKSLFEKVKLPQVLVTGSHTRKVDMSIMPFPVAESAAQSLESLHSKQCQNELYLPH